MGRGLSAVIDSTALVVDEVLEVLADGARVRLDEPVSQLDHALQTAALADAGGSTPELVAAALLHDIGHLLGGAPHGRDLRCAGTGERHHEAVAARFLASWFPSAVTAPIALHVRAKRYLCSLDPTYIDRLSPASRRGLAIQGGPLPARAVATFEDLPFATEAVALRRFDDAAKTPGSSTARLEDHRELLLSVASPRRRALRRHVAAFGGRPPGPVR